MKHWFRVRATLLASMGGLVAGVILCRLLRLSPEYSLLYFMAALTGALSGGEAGRKDGKQGWICFGLGALGAMVPQLVLLPGYLTKLGGMGIFLLSFSGLIMTGWGFYGPLGVWSTLLGGAAIFAGRNVSVAWSIITTLCAVGALGLTLDGFRDSSLRKAFHRKREHQGSGAPKELVRFHGGMACLFLLGAVLAALVTFGFVSGLLDAVKMGITHSFGGILSVFNWIFRAIEWVIQWFSDLFPDLIDDPNPSGGDPVEAPVYTGGPGSSVSTVIMIIIFVIICMAATGLIACKAMKGRKPPKGEEASVDYVDEVEQLERPRRPIYRRRNKPEKFRDITDPELKLRFIFRRMLLEKMKADGRAITQTPNELADPTVPEEPELVEAYNLLRYGNRPVTERQLESAERYLKNL